MALARPSTVPHYLDRVESAARDQNQLWAKMDRVDASGVASPNEYSLSRRELFFLCQLGRSSESHPSRQRWRTRNPITFIAEANMTATTFDRPFSSCRRARNGTV